jgi:Na+/H+ antiporter NhaD/arsenite permease-like protein
VGLLLLMFHAVDWLNYRRAPKAVREALAEPPDRWSFEGLGNLVYLTVILGAVFVERPPFLREFIMVGAATASYLTTRREVHQANHFNFHPIQEVAILFSGIFATMIPALDWLQLNAARLGVASPTVFYWGTGILSSVLDNAPTYLSFLSGVFGSCVDRDVVAQVQQLIATHGANLAAISGPHAEQIRQTFLALQKYHAAHVAAGAVPVEEIEIAFLLGNASFNRYIVAVSVGAVFFGANTYIGNGPNFMVKAIADQKHVHTPSFLGFVFKYSLPCMLPMLLAVWWLFFRG